MTHTTECPIFQRVRQTFDHCDSITDLTDDTYYRMSHPSWGETDFWSLWVHYSPYRWHILQNVPSFMGWDRLFGLLWFHYRPNRWHILQNVPSFKEWDRLFWSPVPLQTDDTSCRMPHPSRSETDCVGHWFHYKQMTLPAEYPSFKEWDRLCWSLIPLQTNRWHFLQNAPSFKDVNTQTVWRGHYYVSPSPCVWFRVVLGLEG